MSLDEALAVPVTLSQPVTYLVDNFLHVPVGAIVPVGHYDRAVGAWVAADNGRVLRVVGRDAVGLALVDSDGDGLADDALGLDVDERQALADRYVDGAELWRVPLPHFSAVDCNFGYVPDPNGPGPMGPDPSRGRPGAGGAGQGGVESDCFSEKPSSSWIECENQTLHEDVPVVGAPFGLTYSSDRTLGRSDAYTLTIPLVTGDPPPPLVGTVLEVEVAGRHVHVESGPMVPHYVFEWDGRDNLGRLLQGAQPVTVKVGYRYRPIYAPGPNVSKAWAMLDAKSIPFNLDRVASEYTLWRTWQSTLGVMRSDAVGLGSWNASIHHQYDATGRVLWLGDGRRRSATALGPVITTVAGAGNSIDDGCAASDLHLQWPRDVEVGPSGEVYVLDYGQVYGGAGSVWRIENGVARQVAGVKDNGCGQSPPWSWSCLNAFDMAVGADGTLYFAELDRIRTLQQKPGATFQMFAGNGQDSADGDGGPALQAGVFGVDSLAFGPGQQTLYFAQGGYERIRAIDMTAASHPVRLVAGGVQNQFPGDGRVATDVWLGPLGRIAAHPFDGTLLFTSYSNSIRRIGLDQRLGTFAGNGTTQRLDGVAPTASGVITPWGMAFAPDGRLYFADNGQNVVRTVGGGIITTIAGTGQVAHDFEGDGGLAAAARFDDIRYVAVAADGVVYATSGRLVLRIEPPLPGLGTGELAVPSEDGSLLYLFDASGRHLRTLDGALRTTLYTFGYDALGRLATVTDAFGNQTTITRSGASDVTITAPYGQATSLTLDGDGHLADVDAEDGGNYHLTYAKDRLASVRTPRGAVASFSYYPSGRLHVDEGPKGEAVSYGSEADGAGYTVTETDEAGATRTLHSEVDANGNRTTHNTFADGTDAESVETPGLLRISKLPAPVGAPHETLTTTTVADPRLGIAAGFNDTAMLWMPASGKNLVSLTSRTATKTGLALHTQTEQLRVNGGPPFVTVLDADARSLHWTSPGLREGSVLFDAVGRPLSTTGPTATSPVVAVYDGDRVSSITWGARATTFDYDIRRRPRTVVTPVGTTSFAYGPADRLASITRPDLEVIGMHFDAAGDLRTLTPPGRPAHSFAYDDRGRLTTYTAPPPLPGGLPTITTFTPNALGKPWLIGLPGSVMVELGYDALGRLSDVHAPDANTMRLELHYNPSGRVASLVDHSDGAIPEVLGYGYTDHLLTDTTWLGPVSGAVHRTFDDLLRLESESVNGQLVATYTYDDDGLPTSAGLLAIDRQASGLVRGTTLAGSTLVDELHYDTGYGELSAYAARLDPNAPDVYEYAITLRDAVGRIAARTEAIGGAGHVYRYGYDLAGRLEDVWRDGNDDAHKIAHNAYDPNGNVLARTTPDATKIGVYDDQDRIVTFGTATYQHAPGGERARKLDAATGKATEYVYDAFGGLRTVRLDADSVSPTVIEYLVDGTGRRIGKKKNGVLERAWLYRSALQPIAEMAGGETTTFVYATHLTTPDYLVRAGTTYRILSDHLGSVRLVLNAATGAVAQRIDYDDWGNVTADTAPGFQPFGFAGGLWDAETGLVRFGVRDYEPETGRWTSKDPSLFTGGTNLYRYANGDPVNYIDVDGRFPVGLLVWGAAFLMATSIESPERAAQAASYVTVGTAIAGAGLGIAALGESIGAGLTAGGGLASGMLSTCGGSATQLTAKSGAKLGQQIARWREIGGEGGAAEFIDYATRLASEASAAGQMVSGTVGSGPQALANATIYRRGLEYLVVQDGAIMSYVSQATPGGIVDEFIRLGGGP